MLSGGSGAWRSRGRSEAIAEPGELDLPAHGMHENILRLDVLVHETAPMDLREGTGDGDREGQEVFHRHWRAEPPLQRLAGGILQHQHGPAAVADELQRPRRPGSVQLVPQGIFVRQAIQGRRCRMLRGREHGQHGVPAAIGAWAPSPAENAVAVLPQDLEVAVSVCAEPMSWAQLPDSIIKPVAAPGLRTSCDRSSAPLAKPDLRGNYATDAPAWRRPLAASPGINPTTGQGALLSALGGAERQLLRSPPGPAYARLGRTAADTGRR